MARRNIQLRDLEQTLGREEMRRTEGGQTDSIILLSLSTADLTIGADKEVSKTVTANVDNLTVFPAPIAVVAPKIASVSLMPTALRAAK